MPKFTQKKYTTKVKNVLGKLNPYAKSFGKDYVKDAYKNLKLTPKQIARKLKFSYKKGEIGKGRLRQGMKGAGVHSFPGEIKNSGRSGYSNGETGLFTQSVKGMKGIHFIERAMDKTIADFKNEG